MSAKFLAQHGKDTDFVWVSQTHRFFSVYSSLKEIFKTCDKFEVFSAGYLKGCNLRVLRLLKLSLSRWCDVRRHVPSKKERNLIFVVLEISRSRFEYFRRDGFNFLVVLVFLSGEFRTKYQKNRKTWKSRGSRIPPHSKYTIFVPAYTLLYLFERTNVLSQRSWYGNVRQVSRD